MVEDKQRGLSAAERQMASVLAKAHIRRVFRRLTFEERQIVVECMEDVEDVERGKGSEPGVSGMGGVLEAVYGGYRISYRVESRVEVVGVVAEDQQT